MLSSSGIIKRGLAATAVSALAVTGVPALAGTANAAVGSVTVTSLSAYDIDELTGAADDITALVKETGGAPTVGQAVEFRTVFTPQGGGAAVDSGFQPNAGVTDADGKVQLAFHPTLAGSYAITVRTAGSQISATPFTVVVGEAEIVWADGASASSPVNGSDSYTATLALTNPSSTPLPGRAVTIELTGEDDANFPGQTSPSVRVDADSATSTTGADGKFTVSLTDPVTNPVVPEDAVLTASAPALKGAGDPANADATAGLAVDFVTSPVVKAVEVKASNVFGGVPAPGKPVELDIRVTSEGPTPAANDDVVLKDYPVAVKVDKGFLTTDTQGAGFNVHPTDLVLTADQDDEGDRFGFYQNLGADETVDTSDDAGNNNAAGIVATIEKDAGFNDDGLVTQTVTVTAGGKTDTATVDYNVRNYLNLPSATFARDGGSTRLPGSIDLKLYAADQFQNLVGDQAATIVDDTPVARVDTEATPDSDFINDNPTATASSSQAVTQTVTATLKADKALVDQGGNPVVTINSDSVTATHVIRWGEDPGQLTPITATIFADNKGTSIDRLKIKTNPKVPDAQVRLYKKIGNRTVLIGAKRANAKGIKIFLKPDRNGGRFTKYFAIVAKTQTTQNDRTTNIDLR